MPHTPKKQKRERKVKAWAVHLTGDIDDYYTEFSFKAIFPDKKSAEKYIQKIDIDQKIIPCVISYKI